MQSPNEPYKQPGKRGGLKSWFSSRKTPTTPSASPEPSQPEPPQPSTTAYRLLTFETITLRQFIDCFIKGERALLVVSGDPTPEAIEDAWLAIYSAYCSAVGNVQFSGFLSRAKQSETLASRVNRITWAVEIARMAAQIEELIPESILEVFEAEGFKINADVTLPEYERQLDGILSKLRPLKIKLAALAEQHDAPGKPPTEHDFRKSLLYIGKFQGFAARDSMPLIDYCTAIQEMNDHFKPKAQEHGRRNT